MAIGRSHKSLAFKTSHRVGSLKGASYNGVRACVLESQEIQAFSIICPPISHSLIMIIDLVAVFDAMLTNRQTR